MLLKDSVKHVDQTPVTFEEYFNSRAELKNRDIGRPREENTKVQTFNAQISLCDDYPLSLQEQILPIIDLMAIRFIYLAIHVQNSIFLLYLATRTSKSYAISSRSNSQMVFLLKFVSNTFYRCHLYNKMNVFQKFLYIMF